MSAMADEAKGDGGAEPTLNHVKVAELQVGDLVVCLERYIVKSIGGGNVQLRTLKGGNYSDVANGIIESEFFDVRARGQAVKVTRTAMTTFLRALVPGLPVRITFRKKQTQKRATDAMEAAIVEQVASSADVNWSATATAADKRKRRRVASKMAKAVQDGELRRMTGFPKGVDEASGRLVMQEVVMEGERKGEVQDRMADLRTIEELIVGGVRYVLK